MNVTYAKTVAGTTIIHFRPDQNYTDTADLEQALNAEAVSNGTTIAAYAIAERAGVMAHCASAADLNTKVQVCQKSEVPQNATIIAPEGVILADIPNDGYVVYIP